MKSIIYGLSAVALTAALGGCATITRGTSEQFTVNSTPPGATVKTSHGFSCNETPCSMKLPRKDKFDVTVTKAGYVTQTVHVRTAVSGGGATALVGNAVVGGLIGVGVDATTGAMNDLQPNPLNVTLVAESAASAPAPSESPAQTPAAQTTTATPATAQSTPAAPAKP